MGTFSFAAALSATAVSGNWKHLPGVPPCDNDLLAGINAIAGQSDCCDRVCSGAANSADYLLRMGYNFSSAIISLDGNPAISFESLPSGFRVLSRVVTVVVSTNAGIAPVLPNPLPVFLQLDEFTEEVHNVPVPVTTQTISYTNTDTLLSVTDLFSNGYGIRITGIGGTLGFFLFFHGRLTGTYDIFSSSISILPNPAVEDDIISITSDGSLTDITRIKGRDNDDNVIIDVDSADFIQWTLTLIRFRFHAPGYSGPLILEGTTFSGSVLLGIIQILLVDGSGIYRIIANKRNDTIYEASSAPSPVTVDVAIPTPFAKTGFIGS